MAEVAILIVDDNIASQNALKSVLDVESWRIRVVNLPAQALAELATGDWKLVIVNAGLADPEDPCLLFSENSPNPRLACRQSTRTRTSLAESA